MPLLKLSFTSLFWAMLLFLGQAAIAGMSPASVSAWRFLLAAAILVPLIHIREGIDWSGLRRHAIPLTVMAFIGVGLFNLFLFHGIQGTSAVNASLIMGLCPIMIACLSATLTGEPIQRREVVGLALSVAGAALVVSGGSLESLLALRLQKGDLLVLAAAGCWALYSALPKRFITDLPSSQITTATVSMGALMIGAYALLTQADFMHWPGLKVSSSILLMSVFGTVLVFLWWNDGVRQIGPRRAAPFMNVVPVFAVLIGLGLGQTITAAQVIGGLLVVSGVATGLTRQPDKKPAMQMTTAELMKPNEPTRTS
jgi:drug/metabolite transporter (DMT)-like permease